MIYLRTSTFSDFFWATAASVNRESKEERMWIPAKVSVYKSKYRDTEIITTRNGLIINKSYELKKII